MIDAKFIRITRRYFLRFANKTLRNEFALSLNDDVTYNFLNSIERLFFNNPSAKTEEELMSMLNQLNLVSYLETFHDIRLEFYLEIAYRYQENRNDEDATRLVASNNSLFQKVLEQEKTFDLDVENAFFLYEKEKLKEHFKELEELNKKKRRKIIRLYSSTISIAAAACLVMIIWQPFKVGNEQLFSNYLTSASSTLPSVASIAHYDKTNGTHTRSENEKKIAGFTFEETELIFTAVGLMKRGDFYKAKLNLQNASVTKERNSDVLLYLAIVQLNTNEIDIAIQNLEYLNNLPKYILAEDVKYHLALAYIKIDKRKEARSLLRELVKENKMYSGQAKQLLKQMRWF